MPATPSAKSADGLFGFRRDSFDGETSGPGSRLETLIVLFNLVRVSHGIFGDRLVEGGVVTEVSGNRGGVAGLGVGSGERSAAHTAIRSQQTRRVANQGGRHLHVAHLANVKVAMRTMRPTQKDVAGRLH